MPQQPPQPRIPTAGAIVMKLAWPSAEQSLSLDENAQVSMDDTQYYVGLVIFTTFTVGWIAWLLLPIPFAAAVAFGAVVAPPDAVATKYVVGSAS